MQDVKEKSKRVDDIPPKIRITIHATREGDILEMFEKNRQDHVLQFLQLGYKKIEVIVERIDVKA